MDRGQRGSRGLDRRAEGQGDGRRRGVQRANGALRKPGAVRWDGPDKVGRARPAERPVDFLPPSGHRSRHLADTRRAAARRMKYMIYEDAITHRFAFLPLPNRFVDGDALPAIAIDRWFDSPPAPVGALPELFTRDEHEPDARVDDAVPAEDVVIPVDPRRH